MKNFKKVQKIAALSLAGLLSCSGLAACGGDGGGSKGGKTELKIKVFNGGLGYAWLQELANNFEEQFKNVSFETGKTGVKIAFTPDKDFAELAVKMKTGADMHDIYYTSDSNFLNFMDEGVAYDVTDIMTADVYDNDGKVKLNSAGDGWATQSKSIADRISVEHTAERLNVGTEAPKYFALPFDDSTAGIIVDWDLFKENGWNDGSGIDGMPGTMQEFYDLLDEIRGANCSAFIYGTGVQYTRVLQYAVMAQVDGTETYYDLFSDYEGYYDFNGDGDTEDEGEYITPATAYKILDTRGYKAAVEMADTLFRPNAAGKVFYDNAVANGVEFGVAQMNFVSSIMTEQPIAMIFEGEWWENEARATFDSMGDIIPEYGYGKREFRMMPIPTFDSTNENQRYTLGAWTGGACTIVNEKTVGNNSDLQKLVELWLQYQYSVEGLKCFSRHTGATLPLEYDMTDKELEDLTPFARDLFKLRRDPRVEVIYGGSSIQEEKIRKGAAQLSFNTQVSTGRFGANVLFNLMLRMSKGGYMVSVEEYIQGMHTWQDQDIIDAYSED